MKRRRWNQTKYREETPIGGTMEREPNSETPDVFLKTSRAFSTTVATSESSRRFRRWLTYPGNNIGQKDLLLVKDDRIEKLVLGNKDRRFECWQENRLWLASRLEKVRPSPENIWFESVDWHVTDPHQKPHVRNFLIFQSVIGLGDGILHNHSKQPLVEVVHWNEHLEL